MNTVLFDLDGTLLRISQEDFSNAFVATLCARFPEEQYGDVVKQLWVVSKKMIENDGSVSNEVVLQRYFDEIYGENSSGLISELGSYYKNEFSEIKKCMQETVEPKKLIQYLKSKGYTVVLATNPIFPLVGTKNRMSWLGLAPEDFDRITTFENSSYCKPNVKYYEEILAKINKNADECIMVGNDVEEDMCASELGMQTFLVKDYLIHRNKENKYTGKQGSFTDLCEYMYENFK